MSTGISEETLLSEKKEDTFLSEAFAENPVENISSHKMTEIVNRFNETIVKSLSGGKSGAIIFLCKDNRILKTISTTRRGRYIYYRIRIRIK